MAKMAVIMEVATMVVVVVTFEKCSKTATR